MVHISVWAVHFYDPFEVQRSPEKLHNEGRWPSNLFAEKPFLALLRRHIKEERTLGQLKPESVAFLHVNSTIANLKHW